MKNLSLPVAKNQSSVISNNDNGTSTNGLRSNDNQRNSGSCDCNFHVPNSSYCWKHGLSINHKQANIPRKEKTLTVKLIQNVFNCFSTSSPSSSSFLRRKSPTKKMQLISSQKFFSSSSSNSKNNKSSTKKDQPSTSSSTPFSVMKLKIFRRNINPKPEETEAVQGSSDSEATLNQQPSSSLTTTTTVGIKDSSKKKFRGKRASRNPSLCPFSRSVSVSDSEEDEEPKPEPESSSNSFLRMARELCSRFTSQQPESFQSASTLVTSALTRRSTAATTATTNEASFLNTFTEILTNPALGSPSERAEIACKIIHSTIEYTNVLVPDMISITAATYYWGMMDRYEAERLLDGKPEGTFLLRDSAQINYLFSVSFRRYQRTLHARIEHVNGIYSFDIHDDAYHRAGKINDLVENYKDPKQCLFYEPQLSLPLKRDFAFDLKHLCRAVITNHATYENISSLPLPPPLKKYLREYHFKQPIRVTDHDV